MDNGQRGLFTFVKSGLILVTPRPADLQRAVQKMRGPRPPALDLRQDQEVESLISDFRCKTWSFSSAPSSGYHSGNTTPDLDSPWSPSRSAWTLPDESASTDHQTNDVFIFPDPDLFKLSDLFKKIDLDTAGESRLKGTSSPPQPTESQRINKFWMRIIDDYEWAELDREIWVSSVTSNSLRTFGGMQLASTTNTYVRTARFVNGRAKLETLLV